MTKTLRLLLATTAVATVALCGAVRALACGNSDGYSYADIAAPTHAAYGISALITPLSPFDVLNGHVAAWVGVGGPGEGPGGSNEWLQVGLYGFPSTTGSDISYEVALPGRFPTYHQVSSGLAVGTNTKVTVLEMHGRANRRRVRVNHKPVSAPILLPESHDRWSPIATTESWDGGTGGTCNTSPYDFSQVSIAHAPGGDWQPLANDYPIQGSPS